MDLIQLPQVIGGYILVLFIPGYAITWALYPARKDLPFLERIAFSFILSIVAVLIAVLFSDIYLGIDVTPVNILIEIILVTVLAALGWLVQVMYAKSRLKQWIDRRFVRRPEGAGEEGKD